MQRNVVQLAHHFPAHRVSPLNMIQSQADIIRVIQNGKVDGTPFECAEFRFYPVDLLQIVVLGKGLGRRERTESP